MNSHFFPRITNEDKATLFLVANTFYTKHYNDLLNSKVKICDLIEEEFQSRSLAQQDYILSLCQIFFVEDVTKEQEVQHGSAA